MYCPKVKRLDDEVRAKVKKADWTKVPPALIGFDVYVDVEGNVGFYEGNSIPLALVEYEQMFGKALGDALAKPLKGKKVGINASRSWMSPGLWEEAMCAKQICERNDVEVILGHPMETKWDNAKQKFYFGGYGNKQYVDVLFNRCPGSHKMIKAQVPESHWLSAPMISPIAHTYVLANKSRTGRALRKFGLESPLAFVVHNDEERIEAAEKIMAHIGKRHPNYEAPYILTKPVCGTGARKVRVHRDQNSDFWNIEYPCLISERITASPIVRADGKHMVDSRMFYTNGFASQAVGRMARMSTNRYPYDHKTYITNICKGGEVVRLDPKVEEILGEYVLAAALAVNERAMQVGLAEVA